MTICVAKKSLGALTLVILLVLTGGTSLAFERLPEFWLKPGEPKEFWSVYQLYQQGYADGSLSIVFDYVFGALGGYRLARNKLAENPNAWSDPDFQGGRRDALKSLTKARESLKTAVNEYQQQNSQQHIQVCRQMSGYIDSLIEQVSAQLPNVQPKPQIGGIEQVRQLVNALQAPQTQSRVRAAEQLGPLSRGDVTAASVAVPALIRALSDYDTYVVRKAAESLGQMGPLAKDAIPALIQTGNTNRDQDVVKAAKESVRKIQEPIPARPDARQSLPNPYDDSIRSPIVSPGLDRIPPPTPLNRIVGKWLEITILPEFSVEFFADGRATFTRGQNRFSGSYNIDSAGNLMLKFGNKGVRGNVSAYPLTLTFEDGSIKKIRRDGDFKTYYYNR